MQGEQGSLGGGVRVGRGDRRAGSGQPLSSGVDRASLSDQVLSRNDLHGRKAFHKH